MCKLSLLSGAKGTGLTAVQKCIHGASSVDQTMFRQLLGAHSLRQSGNSGSCPADERVQLRVERQNLRSLSPDTESWITSTS